MSYRFHFTRLSSLGAAVFIFFVGILVISLSMWLVPSSQAAGTTYHVATNGSDSNSCSAAQSASTPKRTIQAGVNCALQPGDIVAVHAGTYNEGVSNWPASGASGNPIRIQPYGYTNDGCKTPGCGSGESVTWTATNARTFTVDNQSYIRIQGITFANNANGSGNVEFYLHAANKLSAPVRGIEILNNTFTNNGNDGSTTWMTFMMWWDTTGCPTACAANDMSRIEGNTYIGNYGALNALSGASDLSVANNRVTSGFGSRNTDNGDNYTANLIHAARGGPDGSGRTWAPTRVTADSNTIANLTSALTPTELSGFRFDSCSGSDTMQATLTGNTIHDLAGNTTANGQKGYGVFAEANCHGFTVQRNVIYRVPYGLLIGSQVNPSDNALIEHNTIYDPGEIGIEISQSNNSIIRNNIIVGTRPDQNMIGAENWAGHGVGNVYRNNLYYNTGALIATWNDSNYEAPSNLTLSQWNSLSGETGSKNADPLFINPSAGDFRLQSTSPAKGAATDGTDMGANPGSSGTPTPTPTPTPSVSLTPKSIPGTIQAEDYNTGGEGVGYHDMTAGNTGGQYRSDDVDINAAPGGGYTVGYTDPGEWLAYTISVQSTGSYTPSFQTANGDAVTHSLHLELDGTPIGGTISISPTGGYGIETAISGPALTLSQGTHTLKVVFNDGLIDLNAMTFTQAGGPTTCSLYTPTTAIPTGFGSPYDVLSSSSTNLIQTTCDTSSASIMLGKGDPLQYIYNMGYLFKTGATTWAPVNYTSTEILISGAWYPKTASTTLPMTSTELANPSYILGYLCTWTGSQWKCGCRDQACTQSYWQIQSFKR